MSYVPQHTIMDPSMQSKYLLVVKVIDLNCIVIILILTFMSFELLEDCSLV